MMMIPNEPEMFMRRSLDEFLLLKMQSCGFAPSQILNFWLFVINVHMYADKL